MCLTDAQKQSLLGLTINLSPQTKLLLISEINYLINKAYEKGLDKGYKDCIVEHMDDTNVKYSN